MLLGIERSRVVLEVLNQGARLRSFVKHLGLAFVNATPTAHWDVPCVVEIHESGVLRALDVTVAELPRKPGVLNKNRKQNKNPSLPAT
jgi:hypothetical protein